MNVEVLEGCRATTGMTPSDFAAAAGLASGAVPKNANGGVIMDVEPAGQEIQVKHHGPVRVYAIAKDGKFLLGLRTDFEKLGLWYGRVCDVLDKRRDKQITC